MKSAALSTLSGIGRHASRALPIGVVIGLTMPFLAEWVQPLMVPGLLVPLTFSLVRIPLDQLLASFRRWRAMAVIAVWILLASPALAWTALHLVNLPSPIATAALVTAAAPPITACAAIAIFLRLDAAMVVVSTVATMLLVPVTFPPVVFYLADLEVAVGLWRLSLRLAGFIFSAFALALILKKIVGPVRINRHAALFDGVSVVFISIFVVGLMRGLTDLAVADPWFVFQTFAAASVLVLGLYVAATALFWPMGPRTAMAVGLASGNCNMGLMYLVLSDQAALDLLIFFAVGQIPMFFLPSLLAPLIARISAARPPR